MDRIALDVHVHLVPVLADRLRAIAGVECAGGKLRIDGHLVGTDALYRPDRLIEWMGAQRIERAFVSAPPPAYRAHIAPRAAAQWADYLNAGLREICERFPDRLSHLVHLPIEHPALAAALARDAVQRGLNRFSAGVGAGSVPVLSDPALNELWSTLDEAAAFIFLHPGECCDGRLRAFYLENLLGNPEETAVAVAPLVFAGIPEQFSRIRFCLAHGGGNTAMVAGRWQRGFDTGRPGVITSHEAPRLALRRFYVDCIVHDSDSLRLAAAVFGADKLLFGSDWPFPMGLPAPHEQLSDAGQEGRRRIFETNPRPILSAA